MTKRERRSPGVHGLRAEIEEDRRAERQLIRQALVAIAIVVLLAVVRESFFA